MSDLPQLVISYIKSIPEDIVNDIETILSHDKLNLVFESHPPLGPQASLEWLIPTAIAIYISKSYFTSFLEEMGKDHYFLLKKGLKTLWDRIFSKDRKILVHKISTKGKIDKENKYSFLFSIWAYIDDKHRIKFLFEDILTEEEYDKRIELVLGFLEEFFGQKKNLNKYINSIDSTDLLGTILVAYDENTGKLLIIDPIKNKKHN